MFKYDINRNMPHILTQTNDSCGYEGYHEQSVRKAFISAAPLSNLMARNVLSYREESFRLLERGFLPSPFSASGTLCETCNDCLPIRINIEDFEFSDNNQRVLKRAANSGLSFAWTPSRPNPMLFSLFREYLSARHQDSPLLTQSERDFNIFLASNTDLCLYGTPEKLMGFSAVNRHEDQAILSYVAFDPKIRGQSLGILGFLSAIAWAQDENISRLHLGETNQSPSMIYKTKFSGLETFHDGAWVKYDPERHTQGPDYAAMISEEGFEL